MLWENPSYANFIYNSLSGVVFQCFSGWLQPLLIAEVAHSEARGQDHQANGEEVAER